MIEFHVPKTLDINIIRNKIRMFNISNRKKEILEGERYYNGHHDILRKNRTVIGEGGELTTVDNLPNNKIIDNQYAKMVDQKKNYLLGQPIVFKTENEVYSKILKTILNKKFNRLIKNIGEDALNSGIGWLLIYYNEEGELSFKRFKPNEIIPGWTDTDHSKLDYVIRKYDVVEYEGDSFEFIQKVEVYEEKGIFRFIYKNGDLKPDENYFSNYFSIKNNDVIEGWNWTKIPIIPFRCNNKEIPLIRKVKSLQDGLNTILSNFQNNMEEDSRNTILVVVNYDGQDLGEFRKNLATFGAVKVRNEDGGRGGDLKTLSVEVNSENYKTIIDVFKKAIIENAKGYDAKDDRLSGNPNQMNIQSMYSDIDLDANEMETEFQASFEEILWFINMHLYNSGLGDFEGEEVEVIFNRDIMISESEAITNIKNSYGILSNETLISQHPWVDDPELEIKRIEDENKKEGEEYGYPNNFNSKNKGKEDVINEE